MNVENGYNALAFPLLGAGPFSILGFTVIDLHAGLVFLLTLTIFLTEKFSFDSEILLSKYYKVTKVAVGHLQVECWDTNLNFHASEVSGIMLYVTLPFTLVIYSYNNL